MARACLFLLTHHVDILAIDDLSHAAPMSHFAIGSRPWLPRCSTYWAVCRYDSVAHRHLGTGIGGGLARHADIYAIAFS